MQEDFGDAALKPRESMAIWTVYDHPDDFPDCYVARMFVLGGPEEGPTAHIIVAPSLGNIRNVMRQLGLVCMKPDDTDPPQIVESWV